MAELDTDGIRVVRVSSFHETQPVGGPTGQPMFLNAAAELATTIAPLALLARLLEIERRHGRVRTVADGPRTLDLDLLLYDSVCMHDDRLTLPHPRLYERAFVLVPLADIAPQFTLPNGCSVASLLPALSTEGLWPLSLSNKT
jgi:2-amino-4-hydroxy-6-hydroxymethyldihydropteridine diphosphokinase